MSSMVKLVSSSQDNNTNSSSANNNHEDDNQQLDNLFRTSSITTDFLRAAISLKDKVVEVTWGGRGSEVVDPTVYTGLLGTAFTCLRSYEATGSRSDLLLCAEIVDACAAVARASVRHVTFVCGRGGIYAVGSVVANYLGDEQKRDQYVNLFKEVRGCITCDKLMISCD